MTIIIMESVPASLRGEITRWLLEIHVGVFIGTLSALVRERLWSKVCQNSKGGPCTLIWSSNCEQGFKVEYWGAASRIVTNWEGLQLFTVPPRLE